MQTPVVFSISTLNLSVNHGAGSEMKMLMFSLL